MLMLLYTKDPAVCLFCPRSLRSHHKIDLKDPVSSPSEPEMRSQSPDLNQCVSPARHKIFVHVPQPLGWTGVPVSQKADMLHACPVVYLQVVLTRINITPQELGRDYVRQRRSALLQLQSFLYQTAAPKRHDHT